MRKLLGTAMVVLLAAPLELEATDARLGSCTHSAGAWNFVSKEGGRAVIAKQGEKYHVLWITTFVNTGGGREPEGIAAECTCKDEPAKLVWKCRVAFSLDPSMVGAEQTYEWAVDGEVLNSWYVAPDGKRSATPIRRAP